jgi:hypothetical protein
MFISGPHDRRVQFLRPTGGRRSTLFSRESNLPQTHTNARVAQTCRVGGGFFDESTERVCQQLE